MALPSGALSQWEAPVVSSPPADGAAVGTLTDQSGNSISPAQGTASSRGVWRVDGWAPGVPAVELDGVDDRYQFLTAGLAIFQNKPGGTIVTAFRDLGDPAGTSDRPVVYFSRNTSASRFTALSLYGITQNLGSAIRRLDADSEVVADALQAASGGPMNRLLVVSVDAVNAVATIRVDGAISRTVPLASGGNFEPATASQAAYVGMNAALTRFGKVMLGAFALYPFALTPAQMTQVDGHFAAAPYNLVPFGPPVVTVTALTATSQRLSWPAVPTATSYDVERDGVFLTNVTGLSYDDTGLTTGTPYVYRVRPIK